MQTKFKLLVWMIICWKYVRGINVEIISIQWKISGRCFYYEITVGNLFLFFAILSFSLSLISYLHWKVLDQIYVLHCNSVLFFLKSAKGKEKFGKSVEIRIKLLKKFGEVVTNHLMCNICSFPFFCRQWQIDCHFFHLSNTHPFMLPTFVNKQPSKNIWPQSVTFAFLHSISKPFFYIFLCLTDLFF